MGVLMERRYHALRHALGVPSGVITEAIDKHAWYAIQVREVERRRHPPAEAFKTGRLP